MSGEPIFISVVVAAYNEAAVIAGNLQRIVEELASSDDLRYELICVNDGSADATEAIMETFAADHADVRVLHHRRNFGQGRALCTAFAHCRGDLVITLDADLSYGPEYIHRLVSTLLSEKADIALASPYMKGGTVRNVPFYRHLLSRLGNAYLARMSQYSISTSTCVVRAYRREVLDTLVLTSDGMELQLEVLMKASVVGYRVCEVPAKLEWADVKVAEADFRRVSKMRILRSIRLYLLLGWLSRPSLAFLGASLVFILPSLYMVVALLIRLGAGVHDRWDMGWRGALSHSLQELYATYSYSIVIYGFLLVVGLHLFAFGMLLVQNKFYFDEHYRMAQRIVGSLNALQRRERDDAATPPLDIGATPRRKAG